MLQAINLVKAYRGRKVVNNVELNVKKGEIVGLLGPNGAGKTTTFYMVVGLIKPDSGTVFLNSNDITNTPMFKRARKGIGYLTQEPSIFQKLTVEENIMAILETMNYTYRERKSRLIELLNELNISHIAKSKGYMLSGGERRRVEITRSLVTNPSFILLDEPFAGIDPIAVDDIQNIVKQLAKRDIGVLITDHQVRETLEITDRAYIISEGKILETGTPDQLAKSEKVREIYLGENFQFDASLSRR